MGFWGPTPAAPKPQASGGFWDASQAKPVARAPLLTPRVQQLQQEETAAKKEAQKANSFWGLAKETVKGIPKAASNYGKGLLNANVGQAFGNEDLNRTTAGTTANTILGIPKAAKDVLLPTRGYTEKELFNAKPGFWDVAQAPGKVLAEMSDGLGKLPSMVPGYDGQVQKFTGTKLGTKLADAGQFISEVARPNSVEEAKAMRFADVGSLVAPPVGRVKSVAGAADEFAEAASGISRPVKEVPVVQPVQVVNEVDRLIAAGKVRVVRRGDVDVYQTKKGGEWVNARDESSAIAKVTKGPILKKPEPENVQQLKTKLEEERLMLDFLEDAQSTHPGQSFMKYRHRGNSEFAGMLPEVRRDRRARIVKANGQAYADTRTTWEKRGDTIAEGQLTGTNSKNNVTGELDMSVPQDLLDEFIAGKAKITEMKEQIKNTRQELAVARKEPHLKHNLEGQPLPYSPREKGILRKAAAAKNTPVPKAAEIPPLKKSEGELRSYEIAGREPAILPKPPRGLDPLEELVKQTPVKDKVNLLDYVRTPDRVLKKIGLEKEAIELRRAHDAYQKELPKNIDKITAWSKQVGKNSNERIFRYLDGEAIDLAPNERKVAIEIKSYLAQWAERLKLPQDNRIADYITHIFDDQFIKKEFDEDLAKIIAEKIPGQVYNPFLQKRLGTKGYKRDVWGALDAYTKRATRKVHMDPALEAIEVRSGSLEDSQFRYVKSYVDNVNMRPTTIDTLFDNLIKASPVSYRLGQRPTLTITRTMRQMVYRAMLGLNPGSALRNLSQGANVYAKLGEKHTIIGYSKLFSPAARKELLNQRILDNNFIQDRALSATKKAIEKMDKGLFVFFDAAEKINRGAAYLGAKSKGLSKGMSEEKAIEYAKKVVRDTQFNYDTLDTAVGMQPDITKTALQFFTYPVKQSEFLIEMVKNKEYAGAIRYAGSALVFVYTVGQALGMEPKEILPTFRFGVPPSMQFAGSIGSAALDQPDEYGNKRSFTKKIEDVAKSGLTTLVPAGTQIRKSWMGTEAVLKDGSFDKAGRKQYDVGGSPLRDTQAIVFGKSATPEAKKYYKEKEEGKPKTALDIAAEKRKEYRDKTIRPIYDQVQKLDAEGRGDEAQALVDALSDEDYDEYKKVKASAKQKETLRLQEELLPTYEQVQELDAQGRGDEAQAIVDAMTDDEYHAYTLLKEKLK